MISERTRNLHSEVLAALSSPALDVDVKRELYDELAQVEAEIEELENKDFAQFLDSYIAEQDSDKILCSCGNSRCRLKQGNKGSVPPGLKDKSHSNKQETKELAEDWLLDHDGGGEAVREALDEYTTQEASVRNQLRLILDKTHP